MKKLIALLLALVLCLGLFAACGTKEEAPAEEPAATTEAPAEEAEAPAEEEAEAPAEEEAEEPAEEAEAPAEVTADTAEYTLIFAHDHTIESPFNQASQWYKEELEARSGGRIYVEVYPAGQLGNARETIEMVQMGSAQACLLPTAKFSGFTGGLNLADMPFLVETEEDFLELFNGPIGQEAMADLVDIGIKGMAYFPEGFKYTTNNVKPITCPDDMKGMKIRTMESAIIMAQFESWGCNPVPIDFTELYNSLQQNVVDGQENPLLSIHDMKFYEVQKYMTIDSHAYLSYFLCYNNDWFNALPADLQELVTEVSMEAKDLSYELMQEANAGYLQTIKDSGVEVYELTEEETALFKEAVQPVYEEFADLIGEDLLNRAVEESAKIAEARKAG